MGGAARRLSRRDQKTNRIVYRAHEKGVSIAAGCRLVGIPRSSFYFSKQGSKVLKRDEPLEKQIIDLQENKNHVLGRRTMKLLVDKAMGRPISEARIGHIMKRLNRCAIVRRKNPYRQRVKQWQEELQMNP